MNSNQSILITGANGQMGQALKQLNANTDSLVFTDQSNFDITNRAQMEAVFVKYAPKVVINTAAFTEVDAAETNQEKAFLINETGVKNLVELCKKFNSKLIHISTDYVFDGESTVPYKETDTINPVTVYGKSKRAGELVILNSNLKAFAIIRTSWLFSRFGNNFYKTMLRLAETHKELKVVNDQKGNPTNAEHLAKALLKITGTLESENSGIYHFSNTGEASWFDFAEAIFEKHAINIPVKAVPSEQFTTPAKRPAYSVLDQSKIEKVFDISISSWKEALTDL